MEKDEVCGKETMAANVWGRVSRARINDVASPTRLCVFECLTGLNWGNIRSIAVAVKDVVPKICGGRSELQPVPRLLMQLAQRTRPCVPSLASFSPTNPRCAITFQRSSIPLHTSLQRFSDNSFETLHIPTEGQIWLLKRKSSRLRQSIRSRRTCSLTALQVYAGP